LEPDETVLTPVSTPGVSYNPITTLAGRIASKLDGVIDGGSALGCIKDTSGIVLPWLSIAADGERGRLKSCVDGRLRSSNRVNGVDVEGRSARRLHTVAVLGSVGVARFSILTTLGFDPAHGLTRITTTASVIIGVAVNNLLGTEGHDLLSGKQVGGFDGLGGGESPAGTALFLVLNGSGHSLGDPVDSSRRNADDFISGEVKSFLGLESKKNLEILGAHVSELRVTEGGRARIFVKSGNLVGGSDKVLEVDLVFVCGVGPVPELQVLLECDGRRNSSARLVVLGLNQKAER